MNSKKNNLLKINDFAKLCAISRKTLIYYDSIGLFSPIFRDSNGYRFYSYHQYDTITIILALKEVDMPLASIKHFIDNRTPDLLVDTLSNQKALITKRIDNLLVISDLIDNVINSTLKSQKIDFEKIYLKNEAKEILKLSQKILKPTNSNISKAASSLIKSSNDKKFSNGFKLGCIIKKEDLLCENFGKLSYLFVNLSGNTQTEEIFIKDSGLYVIGYHLRSYETSFETYKKLIDFINNNNLSIDGNSYELELLNCLSHVDFNKYVTKISIKVKHL